MKKIDKKILSNFKIANVAIIVVFLFFEFILTPQFENLSNCISANLDSGDKIVLNRLYVLFPVLIFFLLKHSLFVRFVILITVSILNVFIVYSGYCFLKSNHYFNTEIIGVLFYSVIVMTLYTLIIYILIKLGLLLFKKKKY